MAAESNKFKLPRFLKETGVNLQKGGGCSDKEGVCVGGKGLWCLVCGGVRGRRKRERRKEGGERDLCEPQVNLAIAKYE